MKQLIVLLAFTCMSSAASAMPQCPKGVTCVGGLIVELVAALTAYEQACTRFDPARAAEYKSAMDRRINSMAGGTADHAQLEKVRGSEAFALTLKQGEADMASKSRDVIARTCREILEPDPPNAISLADYLGASLSFNFTGLGNSPLGLQLKAMSGYWSNDRGALAIRDFLARFRHKYPEGTDLRNSLEEAGLECDAAPLARCTYAGVYTYEIRRANGKVERSAKRFDIVVNFDREPWDVKATGQLLYGGVSKGPGIGAGGAHGSSR